MLRITTEHSPRVVTFRLEGRLAEPWAAELETCWKAALSQSSHPKVRVDLTGVTFIDQAGKQLLAAMHEQGAEFVVSDCLTKALVEEIAAKKRTT